MEHLVGLAAFIRTVEAGSFSAAARQLGLSPVAVSRSVQRLEQSLGVRLLQRTTRRLSLTREGKRLHDEGGRPLSELSTVLGELRDQREGLSGPVRVTCGIVLGRQYVVPLLKRFKERHPDIQVELSLSGRLADMVSEGFDIGIRVGQVPDRAVVVRPLFESPLVLAASVDYLRARGEPRTPEDLLAHDCIGYRDPTTGRLDRWELRRDGRTFVVPARAGVTLDDSLAVLEAAVCGFGLACLPAYAFAPHLRAGRLRTVLEDFPMTPVQGFLHYPQRRHLPARVQALVRFLREELPAHPDFQPRGARRK